ncbi:hypothetical protein M0804_007965 [Polistes exclamans]|nr:hypothetical protein M0804_007965 [Polistes exclamans]
MRKKGKSSGVEWGGETLVRSPVELEFWVLEASRSLKDSKPFVAYVSVAATLMSRLEKELIEGDRVLDHWFGLNQRRFGCRQLDLKFIKENRTLVDEDEDEDENDDDEDEDEDDGFQVVSCHVPRDSNQQVFAGSSQKQFSLFVISRISAVDPNDIFRFET